MSTENKMNDTITQKLRALADEWEREARRSVPAAYAERGLERKYFNLDNEAAGLMRAAEELREALDGLEDSSGICAKLLLELIALDWTRQDGTIDTLVFNDIAKAVRYLAARGMVEITDEISEMHLLARVVDGSPQETKADEITEFLREVALSPYEDSDIAGLLDTLRTRAQALLEKYGLSE